MLLIRLWDLKNSEPTKKNIVSALLNNGIYKEHPSIPNMKNQTYFDTLNFESEPHEHCPKNIVYIRIQNRDCHGWSRWFWTYSTVCWFLAFSTYFFLAQTSDWHTVNRFICSNSNRLSLYSKISVYFWDSADMVSGSKVGLFLGQCSRGSDSKISDYFWDSACVVFRFNVRIIFGTVVQIKKFRIIFGTVLAWFRLKNFGLFMETVLAWFQVQCTDYFYVWVYSISKGSRELPFLLTNKCVWHDK